MKDELAGKAGSLGANVVHIEQSRRLDRVTMTPSSSDGGPTEKEMLAVAYRCEAAAS